nr:histidine phosphatase family protein [uncultured Roseateles sp.]
MLTPTQFFAIRHGETEWNSLGRYQGQTDIPLNDKGRQQARQTAAALAEQRFDVIYSSDLSRALQTAQALAEAQGLPLQMMADLREQHFGIFQGHTAAELAQRWPEAHARWARREPEFGPEGGETRVAFNQRCLAAIEALARRHAGQRIALVCHGGVLDCLYRAAVGLSLDAPRTWLIENAAVSQFAYSAPQGLTLLQWGQSEHLSGASRDELPETQAAA